MVGQFLSAVAFLVLLLLLAPSAAQERAKIFLGASSKTLGYSPLWVGAKRGFFEQQGLDVQLILLRGAAGNCEIQPALDCLHIRFGPANLEGMKHNLRAYAEQAGVKGPLPDILKFVELGYLSEALKEMGKR